VSVNQLETPIAFTQERLEKEYLDFDDTEPRAMHVDIRKEEDRFLCNFTFFNETEQKIELAAPIHLRATDLEDALLTIRQLWYDIAMSKTFTQKLEGDTDEFLDYIRKFAKAGRNLWTNLFKIEQRSSMFHIGKWLEKHPLKLGAIIQISLDENATDFLFPWSLLYDKKVPKKEYELPDLQGFWGLRYCIEQRLPNQISGSDAPIQIDDKLKLGFMLWEQFRNAAQEKALMERLMNESVNKLEVTMPPIIDADECYDLLDEGNAHILYFYTHGYTRHRQADIGVAQIFNLFLERYKRLVNYNTVKEDLKFLYDSIKQGATEPDRSWIELTYGKLYLDELYDEIEDKFSVHPLVFLNMCESAQITPSLSDSFINFFLDRGARAVVGTECPMTVEFAHPFAEKFFEDLLNGEMVGIALLKARRHFINLKNPLGLAYTLFGSATLNFKTHDNSFPR
jgi:CHAT domain